MINLVKHTLFLLYFVPSYGLELNYDQELIPLVFGGQELNSEKNKHLVQLHIYRTTYVSYSPTMASILCSGSIISDRWILTAAHCLKNNTRSVTVMRKENGQWYEVATGVKYSTKDPSCVFMDGSEHCNDKDIGLVLTEKPIRFTKRVQPIKLATRSIKIGKSAIISGFGEIRPYVSGSEQGRVTMSKCPMRSTTLLCSKDVVRAGSGDSGGSLVYEKKLVGVISKSCVDVYINKPCMTVYVDVVANRDWIKSVTGIQ